MSWLKGRGRKQPSKKMAGSVGRAGYALGRGVGRAAQWTADRDWKAMPGQAADYAKSRPYNLLPWMALITAAGLWPRPRPLAVSTDHPPGLSEDRRMGALAFDEAEPGRGRAARHPQAIPLLGWRDILWRAILEIGADKLPSVAGGVTFYMLLAIFPAIGAFVSVYGLFADVATVQAQLREMSGVFPASVIQIVGDQMLRLAGQHDGRLSIALAVSLLLSVWSANNGMKALIEGLNVAYDEDERRPFFRRTLATYGATFLALLFMAIVAGMLVALPLMLKTLGLETIEAFWGWLRWAIVLGLTVAAFGLVYRYGPSRARPKWRWVFWGALAGALLWIVGSLGFSFYVGSVAHLDRTYGPLGTVIGFMIWVWFSVMTLLLGAELNAEIEHQTAVDSTTGPEAPMGERGAAMADTVGKPLLLGETLAAGAERVKETYRSVVRR